MIEANATYRGWFTGGNQTGEWENAAFVAQHIAGRGALGAFFNTQLGGTIKMGDSPSVARLVFGVPEDPAHQGWGGHYVRAWDRSQVSFHELTTSTDRLEQFGVMELILALGAGAPDSVAATMLIENQALIGFVDAARAVRFRFSPKDAKTYSYTIRSTAPELNGRVGEITSFTPPPEDAARPADAWPNWWTDDPAPALAEGPHLGAKTVSRWREAFLGDFARRMQRCAAPP
jgi:hypothetical protein